MAESDRRVLSERLDAMQQSLNELRHGKQALAEQNARLQSDLANSEVQRSGLEAQVRLANWPRDACPSNNKDEELSRQLQQAQRERSELKGKVDALNDKVRNCLTAFRQSKVD